MNIQKISIYILFCFIFFNLCSCYKSDPNANQNLAQLLIQDKVWFLEYKQVGTSEKVYVGQASYNIELLKVKSTKDSDGAIGKYSILNTLNGLSINFNIKSLGGTSFYYNYIIEKIGDNNMIFSSNLNNSITYYYYSTRK